MKRYLLLLTLALLGLTTLIGAAPAGAQSRTRCFSETGFCIAGPILDYWQRNGGLPVFGYPISDLHTETVEGWTGPVQLFERDRLEDHGSAGVMAGRLGAQLLETQGRPWQTFPRVDGASADCRFFRETGHSLCGTFLSYWLNNGGLERFGYPLTEPLDELLSGGGSIHYYTVQYFERRRMELHTENHGTPYEVLLGLLARDLYKLGGCQQADAPLMATAAAYRASVGCPTWTFPPVTDGVGAFEPFERGSMIWVKGGYRSPSMIYVIFFDNTRGSLVWQSYIDTWYEGEPASGGETAPAGLYEPIRGFGKVWRSNPQVRNTLGWASAPERAESGAAQSFSGGAKMLYRASADRVFILYPDGHADDIARIP